MRSRILVGMLLVLAAAPMTLVAQDEPGPAENLELDPIRCWWRSEKPAVYMGEQFRLVLTCSVVETSEIRVVPQTEELEPTAIALIPFEIVGGRTHEDFVDGPWRYFQYEYSVRLLAEDLFGEDVEVPPLAVTYNVQSTTVSGAEGMDRTYVLPALPIRIHSLVPDNADDIRDEPTWTFADMEQRRLRSSLTRTIALVVFGFAVLLAIVALVRGFGHFRRRKPVVRTAPVSRVLSGCAREIAAVRTVAGRDGWSADLAGRAMAALRIAGAVALGHPVAQTVLDGRAETESGQILVRAGLIRPRRVLVSASTTTLHLDAAIADGASFGALAPAISSLRDALAQLNASRYVHEGALNELVLDQHLDEGAGVVARLRRAHLLPGRAFWSRLRGFGGNAAS
ncbi:MAG: hypothetical protein VYE73_11795 [Acidobacteriota bacterium]|nr:hypothetical protein [Acidobacteriota bacterium]